MLRVRRRRVYGVGPRSAHIAGLTYSCFLAPERLVGARPETLAPRPGDPADYLALRLADGTAAALTNTCAANALGLVPDDDYAAGHRRSATAALDIAGQELGLPGTELARRMIQASTEALADLVTAVATQHRLTAPTLIAVGGGAGVLGRSLAGTLGLDCQIPPGAEVISSMGDALSLVRAERERTVSRATPAEVDALIAEVEAEALAAGAAPTSRQVQVSQISDRGAIRAVAVGALVIGSGVVPGRPPLGREEITEVARAAGGSGHVDPVGRFWLSNLEGRVLLFDRFGDTALDVRGEAILINDTAGEPLRAAIGSVLSRVCPACRAGHRRTHHLGDSGRSDPGAGRSGCDRGHPRCRWFRRCRGHRRARVAYGHLHPAGPADCDVADPDRRCVPGRWPAGRGRGVVHRADPGRPGGRGYGSRPGRRPPSYVCCRCTPEEGAWRCRGPAAMGALGPPCSVPRSSHPGPGSGPVDHCRASRRTRRRTT